MLKFEHLAGLALAASTVLAASTAEAAFVWTFGANTNALVQPTTTFSSTVSGKTVTATVSSWADSGAAGDVGRKLYQGNTYQYAGGLGVQWKAASGTINGLTQESTGQPEHTMDNCGLLSAGTCTADTPEDFILFKFSDPIALTQISTRWWSGDSDVTVLAYTGAGDPTAKLPTDTYSTSDAAGGTSTGLLNDGWSLVGNYNDVGSGIAQNTASSTSSTANINAGGVTSSYWLIGAYNARINPSLSWDATNDFLKVYALAGNLATPPGGKVPEPSSVALAVLGLAAVRRYRSRLG